MVIIIDVTTAANKTLFDVNLFLFKTKVSPSSTTIYQSSCEFVSSLYSSIPSFLWCFDFGKFLNSC